MTPNAAFILYSIKVVLASLLPFFKILSKKHFIYLAEPLKPPPFVSAEKSSSRNVSVQWSAIPHQDIPGYLQGYHIYYSPADNQTVYRTLSVGSFETSAQLAALDKYTMYKIHVSGFTVKGDGPIAETYVRTDEDGKKL